jgi:hypothetical protein
MLISRVTPDHKKKNLAMSRKIHDTNFFHIYFLDTRTNIKCQNGPVLPPAQGFYFNGQALIIAVYHLIFCFSCFPFQLVHVVP